MKLHGAAALSASLTLQPRETSGADGIVADADGGRLAGASAVALPAGSMGIAGGSCATKLWLFAGACVSDTAGSIATGVMRRRPSFVFVSRWSRITCSGDN
eukprot:scaffold57857_cov31-Tisochrysis_lutea.AAC.3